MGTRSTLEKAFDSVVGSNTDEVWEASLALGGCVLRRTDELGRERLLRNVERQLREDLDAYAEIEAANHDAG